MICSMNKSTDSDLDIQAYCRGLALQQIQMLTRLAEIAMQLAEGEGARAVAAQARAAQPEADEAAVEAAGAEAQEAGLAFSRFSSSVQRSLAQRARAAADLCARDKADRKARRARQRDHVTDALHALIWDAGQPTREPRRGRPSHQQPARAARPALSRRGRPDRGPAGRFGHHRPGLRPRPVRRMAPPGRRTGRTRPIRRRRPAPRPRSASVAGPGWHELMQQTLDAISDRDKAASLQAGVEARLKEPDVEALIDAEPPAPAAARLCRSLGIDFRGDYEEPDEPDTG